MHRVRPLRRRLPRRRLLSAVPRVPVRPRCAQSARAQSARAGPGRRCSRTETGPLAGGGRRRRALRRRVSLRVLRARRLAAALRADHPREEGRWVPDRAHLRRGACASGRGSGCRVRQGTCNQGCFLRLLRVHVRALSGRTAGRGCRVGTRDFVTLINKRVCAVWGRQGEGGGRARTSATSSPRAYAADASLIPERSSSTCRRARAEGGRHAMLRRNATLRPKRRGAQQH